MHPPTMNETKAAKAMKAMKSIKADKAVVRKTMKGWIASGLAAGGELKKTTAINILDALASIAQAEVKKVGKFVIPGVVMIKTCKKPATTAGKMKLFGKEVFMKAKPARTVVKAFPVSPLKQTI